MKYTETFKSLMVASVEAGTNLGEICRMANVDRSILERWKKREPKTIRILRALEGAIAKAAAEKKAVPEALATEQAEAPAKEQARAEEKDWI